MDFILDILLNLYGPSPYLALFGILLICGLGVPLPEDIILFAGGLAAYYGLTNLFLTIAVCYFGVLCGDSLIFFLGRKYGKRLTQLWFFRKLLPKERLESVQESFNERGNGLIFVARFMPGLRAPIFFSAGTLHLPYQIFLFYDGVAAFLSVPAIIYAVYVFGDELDRVVKIIKSVEHGIVLVIVLLSLLVLFKWYLTRRRPKKDKKYGNNIKNNINKKRISK